MSPNSPTQVQLSVVIPTFNNLAVLQRCLASWREFASDEAVELLVIEDGCRDGTPEYLDDLTRTAWGRRFVRWFHENDVNELRCNNRGFTEARGALLLVWQDDMFLTSSWLVCELVETFRAYPDVGLIALSRGMNCFPLDEPITTFEELVDWRRLPSTIGSGPLNWLRLQEVDVVIRPWVVRRECLKKVGVLDEAFCPHEWDESDLCFRLREAGWKVATHGYERDGAFVHLGSSTIAKKPREAQNRIALENGLIFHERWDAAILRDHDRERQTWLRRMPIKALAQTTRQIVRHSLKGNGGAS